MSDGTLYSDISENFNGNLTNKNITEVLNSLNGMKLETIDGDTIEIVSKNKQKNFVNELVRSKTNFDKSIANKIPLKLNVLNNVDEVIETSKYSKNKLDVDNRHSKYEIESFDTRNSLVYDGTDIYKVTFDVALMKDGRKIAYDIKDIKRNNFKLNLIQQKKNSSSSASHNNETNGTALSSYENNISQNNEKIKYSKEELNNSSFSLSEIDNKIEIVKQM